MKNEWNSGIEDKTIKPIADKAIKKFGDFAIRDGEYNTVIHGHKVKLVLNDVLDERFYRKFIMPESIKDAEHQVNVQVGINSLDEFRWYVRIYYRFKDGKWIHEPKNINRQYGST